MDSCKRMSVSVLLWGGGMAQVTFSSPALLCGGVLRVCVTAGTAAVSVPVVLVGGIVPRHVGPDSSVQLGFGVSCPAHPARCPLKVNTSEDVC